MKRPQPSRVAAFFFGSVVGRSAGFLDGYRTRDVGFVFQFYHLLPELTVTENALLPAMVLHGRVGYMQKRAEITRRATRIDPSDAMRAE